MNDISKIIIEFEHENLLNMLTEVWNEEQPANPNECDKDWEHGFSVVYANCIRDYYDDILNSSDLDPIIKQLIDYDSIDWNKIAMNVILHTDKLDTLIGEFEEQYERERLKNMSEEEEREYYRDIEGDRQYDAYVDDLINGD